MKTQLLRWIIVSVICGMNSFMLQAQESIRPLASCQHAVTLTASPQLRSRTVSAGEVSRIEYPFSAKEQRQTIYALSVDLAVTFTAKDGYFSVILEDQEGKQYLVYRDIAIFNKMNVPLDFSGKAFETAFIDNGISPKKIIVNKTGCNVLLNDVHRAFQLPKGYSVTTWKSLYAFEKHKEIQSQVDRINSYNQEHQILWVAKRTSLSNRPYSEIRRMFDYMEEVEAYGLEHYGGGIYTPMAYSFDEMEFLDTTTAPYVEYFDWSDRHGINWNTFCREQFDTYSCWAQATASAMESYIKRYYGEDEDRQVSILQIIACSGALEYDCSPEELQARKDSCGPIWSTAMPMVAEYLKQPIVSEEDFPFTDKKYQPCEKKPKIPLTTYRVEDVFKLSQFESRKVMHTLINKGPLIACIPGHEMLLSGYGVVNPNLILDYWPTDTNPIPADHPLCGKVYWSFKNSFGDNFGNGGYSYFVRVKRKPVKGNSMFTSYIGDLYYLSGKLYENHRPNTAYLQRMNQAYDADGDGYYRWGLIGRPSNDTFIPEEQDGDDSDPLAGPMNRYGFCKELRKTDLYVQDVIQDKGVEPYLIDAPQWESPAIWVRQNSDWKEEHQNPNFSKNNRCYVYVRIHNKGIKPSNQRAMIRLYWSYASPTQWWDSFHGNETITINGQKVSSGGEVGTAVIPSIPAGKSTIIQIPWDLPSELIVNNDKKEFHACLLAEITDIQDPYYMVNHSDFRQYVQANNNVAQKNIHIINVSDEDSEGSYIDDIVIYNPGNNLADYSLVLDRWDNDLQDYATIKDQLEISYQPHLTYKTRKLELYHPMEFIPIDSTTTIKNIRLEPKKSLSIKIKANFLVQKQTEQTDFKLRVRAIDEKTKKCIGGNTYIFRKAPRPIFIADVVTPILDDPIGKIKYEANDINEPANYTWSTAEGKEIAKGKELTLTPNANLSEVTLSVEATKDGFLDRKVISLPVRQGAESASLKIYPNPTKGVLTVELTDARQEGMITISSAQTGKVYHTIATHEDRQLSIDLSTLPQGNYLLSYYDGTTLIATEEVHKL